MSEVDYVDLLKQLKEGEIKEIFVTHDQYLDFRQAWLKLEDRSHFKGIAHLGGNVTFVYEEHPSEV